MMWFILGCYVRWIKMSYFLNIFYYNQLVKLVGCHVLIVEGYQIDE